VTISPKCRLLHTKLFEPVRNLLHRSPAEYTLLSFKRRQDDHVLSAKDCNRSRAGAHVRFVPCVDIRAGDAKRAIEVASRDWRPIWFVVR
jgi:hypothetical protein